MAITAYALVNCHCTIHLFFFFALTNPVYAVGNCFSTEM